VPRATTYAHLGWRRINGRDLCLHGAGAIGADGAVKGIEVDAGSALSRFELPEPPVGDELRAAVRASLRMLELGPPRITAPVHAAVYRAVLGKTDYSLHLSGETGVFKSEVAALAQQHYGPGLDRLHLVGWSSTGNALEGLAFAAKDTLVVVDDFAPHGTAHDTQRLHREADRLLRAQGNSAGRMRMRADATLRPAKPPRGMILSTGEDTPAGHSLRARMLVVEIRKGDIDPSRLAELQRAAAEGLLAKALAGFVQWLAPQLETVRREATELARAWRERSLAHRRTADALGSLAAGHAILRRFAVEVCALSLQEANELGKRVDASLLEVGAEQVSLQASEDPVRRFLDLLVGVFSSGEAHLADADDPSEPPEDAERWGWRERPESPARPGFGGAIWAPLGSRIGWVRGDELYLEPEATWRAVQRFADGQHQTLAVSQHTLRRRLDERGLLASREPGRTTAKVQIGGGRRRIIRLRASALSYTESGALGANGAKQAETAPRSGFSPDSRPDPTADAGPSGAGNGAESSPRGPASDSALLAPKAPIGETDDADPAQEEFEL
jgi:hypothetical protein